MQSESWERGQQFDRMSALATFTGNGDFWSDLDNKAKIEYAGICRPNPRVRTFFLELWKGSKVIQDAVAEYRAEKDKEKDDQSNVDLEF
jgi:phytoene dehydrogenase-like protein